MTDREQTRRGLASPDGRGGIEIRGADALAIRGLMAELPDIGMPWPDERRQAWADAALAIFAVLYESSETVSA